MKIITYFLAAVTIYYGSLFAQEEKIFQFGSYGKLLIDVQQDDLSAALEVLVKSFATEINRIHNLNYKFENETYNSLTSLEEDLSNNKVDCLSLSTDAFFDLNKDNQLQPYFTGSADDDPYRVYYLIVKSNNKIKSIEDLRGKKIQIAQNNHSALTDMWLYTMISKHSKINKLENYFSEIRQSKSESKALLEIYFERVDGGIVTKSAYDIAINMNPQLKNEMVILKKSDKLITGLFALRKALDDPTKKLFFETALRLGEDEKGKQILSLFKINVLHQISDKHLESARILYDNYNANINEN